MRAYTGPTRFRCDKAFCRHSNLVRTTETIFTSPALDPLRDNRQCAQYLDLIQANISESRELCVMPRLQNPPVSRITKLERIVAITIVGCCVKVKVFLIAVI